MCNVLFTAAFLLRSYSELWDTACVKFMFISSKVIISLQVCCPGSCWEASLVAYPWDTTFIFFLVIYINSTV